MKLKLQRQIPIVFNGNPYFIEGFYQDEVGYVNSAYVDTLSGEMPVDYAEIDITLSNLNLLANDITRVKFALDYKTRKLEREQIDVILGRLDCLLSMAILAESPLFNPKIASVIAYQAYERGHSAGIAEVIGCSFNLVEFAKSILSVK